MRTLYIFSGLPGVGKSTLAAMLCRYIGASYLRVDVIEQSLKNFCGLTLYNEGYLVAAQQATDCLKQGLDVVADSCNLVPQSRELWEQSATTAQASFVNIEVICTNRTEHKLRIEQRISTVDGLVLPTWEDVCNREQAPWNETIITIDTADISPEMAFRQLVILLNIKKQGE